MLGLGILNRNRALNRSSPYVDSGFDLAREEKRREWAALGATPALIEKGFKFADEYSRKMSEFVTKDPELQKRLTLELYPKALDFSTDWIKAMLL